MTATVRRQLDTDVSVGCREDEMGNIYGRLQGADSSKGAVSSGSHCDAIPLAGMYDGTLGVLGPIMAIKAIQDAVRLCMLFVLSLMC